MKNKGFTLIELLVTIALIAAISVAVGVSTSGLLSRQDNKRYKDYRKQIENAACTYAEINNILTNTNVKIQTLIDEGLIKKDVTNPKTNASISAYQNDEVKIIWENYERKCEYTPSDKQNNE